MQYIYTIHATSCHCANFHITKTAIQKLHTPVLADDGDALTPSHRHLTFLFCPLVAAGLVLHSKSKTHGVKQTAAAALTFQHNSHIYDDDEVRRDTPDGLIYTPHANAPPGA
jgi:hypothetical protein